MTNNEMTKWFAIASTHFADNQFSNWILVNKAYNTFQNSSIDFNEISYKTQAAVLNGLLTHYLDASNCKCLEMQRVGQLLYQFDKLIVRSIWLEQTPSLNTLQCLIKCIFYTRLADFILFASFSQPMASNLRLAGIAMFCYHSALKWAAKGCQGDQMVGDQMVDPLLSLCAAELLTLYNANLRANSELNSEIQSCNCQLAYSFLRCYTKNAISPSKFDSESDSSFLLSDVQNGSQNFYQGLKTEKLIAKMTPLFRNVHFLRRFVWILANEPDLRRSNYAFLDELFGLLPAYLENAKSISISTPESITRADIKIFFLRLSLYLKPCKKAWGENCVIPWIFYEKTNAKQQQFLDSLFAVLENHNILEGIGLPNMIVIANTLEQIRIPVVCRSDVWNLIRTMEELASMADSAEYPNSRIFYRELAEKYANAAISAVSDLPTEADDDFEMPKLFPSEKLVEEESVREAVEQFYANKCEQKTISTDEKTQRREKTPEQTDRIISQVGLSHAAVQTETIQTEKNKEKEDESKVELTKINSMLARLVQNNRSLTKLFQ